MYLLLEQSLLFFELGLDLLGFPLRLLQALLVFFARCLVSLALLECLLLHLTHLCMHFGILTLFLLLERIVLLAHQTQVRLQLGPLHHFFFEARLQDVYLNALLLFIFK